MIFLIHGKDSSEKSLTLNSFLKIIPNEKYFFITYDSNKSYKETFNTIDSQLKNNNISENDIIVGHSLGGYWTIVFSHIYNTKKILINPCLIPTIVGIKDYKDLNEYLTFNRAGLCLTSSNDEVLGNNYEVCKEKLKSIEVVNIKETHRITDFEKYKMNVNELLGEYLW